MPDTTKIIHITQEDIDQGQVMSCTRCPIARAAKRVLRPRNGCLVVTDRLSWLDGEGTPHTVELPSHAQEFILGFDLGFPARVKPFSFAVTISE